MILPDTIVICFVTVRLTAISCPEILCTQMFCTQLRPFIPNQFIRLVIHKEYDFPLEYVKCGVGLISVKKKKNEKRQRD